MLFVAGLLLKTPSFIFISALLLMIIGATILSTGFEVKDSLVINDSGANTVYQYNTTQYQDGVYSQLGLIIILVGLLLVIFAVFT
jgi:hypothetical protein